MTQPDDSTEALPTRHVPPAPAGGDEPTAFLGAGDPTAYLGDAEPTVPASTGERTETLAAPTATRGTATVTGVVAAGTGGERTGALAAPTAGPGGELRFGPGVPSTPPSAPAWPVPPTPRPARPSAWRRFVSVLSGLLTLVLLAAVGLWIWQRLSPLEIVQVSVAVPQPADRRCDVTVDVVATVHTNGRAGVVQYQWLRSGSAPGALLDERVGWGQRTVELTLRWTFSGVGSTTETATVNIVSPAPVQAGTEVTYSCPG
ncbi:hypothetical protein [Micromonospora radicis]|uniref:Uncharacterized protein n=1 Tax=Micromonospora radicis TaxID=1894971 RepID=A0A418N1T8_9ACTN|nr:hypothetical protein [Micromonospora radicis]RIV41561.1 hypothetical protein D2L64_02460 [Micromonospora radicis]